MSSSSTTPPTRKAEWLVIVPDHPGTLAKRLEVRPQHFAALKPLQESDRGKMGGAILEDVPVDDDPASLRFCGSTLILEAATREEILDSLRGDVYATSGVWDLEKVQMWPLKLAFRKAL